MKTTHALAASLTLLLCATAHSQTFNQKFVAVNGSTHDGLGESLDSSGDFAVLGAPFRNDLRGTAYVFERADGIWDDVAQLQSPTTENDRFGGAVAIDGSTVVVGAVWNDHAAGTNAGAAYVFENLPGGWTLVQTLTAPDGHTSAHFGAAVAIDGDTLVVSATNDNSTSAQAGSLYVYERAGGVWTQIDKLVVDDGLGGFLLGGAIALSGDELIAGKVSDYELGLHAGAAFVFERGPGGWAQTAKLTGLDTDDLDAFGDAVDIEDGWAVVGAPANEIDGDRTGSAYVFQRTVTGWVRDSVALVAPDQEDLDRFGSSVAISEGRVVVGAESVGDGICGGCRKGAVYGFARADSGWFLNARFDPVNPGTHEELGHAMVLEGDTLLSGAPGHGNDRGAGYAFHYPDYAVPYGHCAAGAPCGNDDPFAGCATSLGDGALLVVEGSGSVVADDLVITATNLPANQFGIVFMGAATTDSPFGDGLLQVGAGGAGLFRFPVQNAGSNQTIVEGPGIVAFSQSSFPAAGEIVAGSEWQFQGWFRDPGGPCGGGFNLTNAASVSFGL